LGSVDHELNSSAFAVRVVASTGASLAACVSAGLSALSGPRHGEAAMAKSRTSARKPAGRFAKKAGKVLKIKA
jgi:citrate synthase